MAGDGGCEHGTLDRYLTMSVVIRPAINISELPTAIGLTGAEYFPLVQDGTTKRAATGLLADFAQGSIAQDANTVFSGPASGAVAAPAFRQLVAADLAGGSSGTSGYVLSTDGASTTAWIAPLTIGTTAIASGTATRILYDNAGTLGEYTITGTGTVVAMATSPAFTTPSLGVATATSLSSPLLKITGSGSGTISLQGATAAGTYTLTLPTDDGTAGQFLQTDGSGVLSWALPSDLHTALVAQVFA